MSLERRGEDTSTDCGNVDSRKEESKKLLRRFLGGTVGGIMQAACAYPLETVKTRLQCGILPDIYSCVNDIWMKEGVRGFYRGVTPQLILGGVYNSVLFGINQFMVKTLTPEGHNPDVHLPLWRTVLAAEMTAPIHVLLITPMENVKVKMQARCNDGVAMSMFNRPSDCMCHIMKTAGPRGFFSGYMATTISCAVGFPFYFSGFQMAHQYLADSSLSKTPAGRDFALPMLSGCVAGILFWASNYPLDFLKTQMQSGATNQTMLQIITSTYKKGGILAFYRGFPACILRSIPANASVWFGIEWTRKRMETIGL